MLPAAAASSRAMIAGPTAKETAAMPSGRPAPRSSEITRGVGDRLGVERRHLQRAHAGQVGNDDLEAGAGERLGETRRPRIVAAVAG